MHEPPGERHHDGRDEQGDDDGLDREAGDDQRGQSGATALLAGCAGDDSPGTITDRYPGERIAEYTVEFTRSTGDRPPVVAVSADDGTTAGDGAGSTPDPTRSVTLAERDDGSAGTGRGPLAAVRLGLLTQLANPKVAVFFGSIFVTLLPAEPSVGVQAAVIAIVCANEVGWYTAVAYAFAIARLRRGYARAKTWIDRTCGGFLALLGLRLVVEGR